MTDIEHYTHIVEELRTMYGLLFTEYSQHVNLLGHELALRKAKRSLADPSPYAELVRAYSHEYGTRMLSMILDEIAFFNYAIKHLEKYE